MSDAKVGVEEITKALRFVADNLCRSSPQLEEHIIAARDYIISARNQFANRSESAEDALDLWWNEDHFGEKCDPETNGRPRLDGAGHSGDCVSAAFTDGYAAGRNVNNADLATIRSAVEARDDETAGDAVLRVLLDRRAEIAEMRKVLMKIRGDLYETRGSIGCTCVPGSYDCPLHVILGAIGDAELGLTKEGAAR